MLIRNIQQLPSWQTEVLMVIKYGSKEQIHIFARHFSTWLMRKSTFCLSGNQTR